MKKPIYVHIGYHKTGTTAIQNYLNMHPEVNLFSRSKIAEFLLEKTPYSFSANEFEDYIESVYISGKKNVISDEELSGNIHTAGNGRSVTYETIEKLAGLKNYEVIIVLVIRNQVDAIDSCYRQYIKKGGSSSITNYLAPELSGHYRHRLPGFSMEHFLYSDVIDHAKSKFSVVNVGIYEEQKYSLLDWISEVISVDRIKFERNSELVNASYSNVILNLARYTNRFCAIDPLCGRSVFRSEFLYKLLLKSYLIVSTSFKNRGFCFEKEVQQNILKYFKDDNLKTENILNKKLKNLGYY